MSDHRDVDPERPLQALAGREGEGLGHTAPDDEVTALLAALAVQSSVYCLYDLSAPWGFAVEGAATAKFHVVLDGGCWLQLAGQEPVSLGPGDLAILPGGQRHTVSDRPDSPVTGLDQLIADHPLDADARLVSGGGGPAPGCCAAGSPSPPRPWTRCSRCCRRS